MQLDQARLVIDQSRFCIGSGQKSRNVLLVIACLCTASTNMTALWLCVSHKLHARIRNTFMRRMYNHWLQEIQQERLRLQSEQVPQVDSPEASNSKQQVAKAKILIVAQEVCIQLAPATTFLSAPRVTQPSFQSEV